MLKNSIHIVKNFLTESEVKQVLDSFNEAKDKKVFNSREFIDIENMSDIKKKCEDYTKLKIDYWQTLKCPEGSSFDKHKDNAEKETVASMIIFLNENFKGGCLLFDNVIVYPAIGKAVFFDGVNIEHSVNKNIGADRYIIAGWFK
ncbi:MAG: 2OG-Fe(II) oxygenase [Flavobacteriaceae bacterium]